MNTSTIKVNLNLFPLLWRGSGRGLYFILFPFISFAQKQVEIVNANSLKSAKDIAEGAKRLIGDVQLKHENTLMFCDSAYFYSNNSIDAFGHVHIQQNDGINLYGDFLKYSGDTKMAVLTSNVLVNKGDMQLTTQVLNYETSSGIGFYNTPGRIVSKENVLTSDRGTFFSQTNDFYFKNNVVLTNPQFTINCDTMRYNTVSKITYFLGPTTVKSKENTIYCENGWYDTNNDLSRFSQNAYIISKDNKMLGDSIFYDRKQAYGQAFGNVQIIDTAQNITIGGDYAVHYELTDISYVTGHALLTQRYDNDTLFLHADTLKAVGDNIPKDSIAIKPLVTETKDKNKESKSKKQKKKESESTTAVQQLQPTEQKQTGKKLFAYHKVKFLKKDLQGKCDSLAFTTADSMMRLYGSPVIWSDENQLTADSMNIQTGEKAIQSIELTTGGFIVSQEDSLKYNQIRGKYIKGFFKKNELYLIKVDGNGQTIYYAKDKNKITAVNRADCSNIKIYIKDKKVSRITFITKPESTLYPLDKIDIKELRLKDFHWRGSEKPKNLDEIFTW
jgi:lipopolysaccharide export system protein LptA